ncbi:hypothetical protein ACHQM5_027672 [Ranunculus cassubicifolius]
MADLMEYLPKLGGVLEEIVSFIGPLWIAMLIGVVVGWIWRPKWVDSGRYKLCICVSADSSSLHLLSFSYLSLLKNQLASFSYGGVEKNEIFSNLRLLQRISLEHYF